MKKSRAMKLVATMVCVVWVLAAISVAYADPQTPAAYDLTPIPDARGGPLLPAIELRAFPGEVAKARLPTWGPSRFLLQPINGDSNAPDWPEIVSWCVKGRWVATPTIPATEPRHKGPARVLVDFRARSADPGSGMLGILIQRGGPLARGGRRYMLLVRLVPA
ncbi:MAG: hypothetical protein LBJ38_03790 [Oscillospiraceae bacterium]|jgi:hypothetical protein|nr:hypothetical protein [Oscillospiraceae bacterium]